MNRMQQSKFHNVFRRMGQMKSLVPRNLISAKKKSKDSEKKINFLINYFRKSNLLISTFTSPVDYKKQENRCKSPLFTSGCKSQKSGSKRSAVLG